MMRIALVGTGDAGRHHARALLTLAGEGRLVWSALCARNLHRLAALRAEWAVPESVASFSDLDALIEARVCDAVILATPDGLHAEQAERAARAGLHVLVEKPFALSRTEGARAVASARASGVALVVGYHLRHHAGHRRVKEQLDALVGEVRGISVRWAWPDPAVDGWRARGAGARFWSLAALGTHCIDLAMWMAGTPAALTADDVRALVEPRAAIDQSAEVSLRLGAVLAHVSVSVTHRALSRVVISGETGEVEALGTLGARGEGELSLRRPRQAPGALAFEPVNPYAAQLRDFVTRAPLGFASDPALLANLDVLDLIAASLPGRTP